MKLLPPKIQRNLMLLHVSGILFLLSKLLIASSTDDIDVLEVATPSVIKANFIEFIQSRDLDSAKDAAKENPFLTAQFNADIFKEVLDCYQQKEDKTICDQFYALLEPSYSELSKSETTPLIMAIFARCDEVFDKLVDNPDHLTAVDAHGRTALMYAVRLDREYMMLRMLYYGLDKIKDLERKEQFLNASDKNKMTVMHHVCDSAQSEQDKTEWIRRLKGLGGKVVTDVPYQANVWNLALRDELTPLGAELYHKDWKKSVVMAQKFYETFLYLMIVANRVAILNAIIPHLFTLWNCLPIQTAQALFYFAEQFVLEGFDSNVVISFDLPSGVYHFSINLLMILFVAYMMTSNNNISSLFRS